jgi:hypothetical protein
VKVADWIAAPDATEQTRSNGRLLCLACNEPVEKCLSALASLRCLACRETNAPLDAKLFAEPQANGQI